MKLVFSEILNLISQKKSRLRTALDIFNPGLPIDLVLETVNTQEIIIILPDLVGLRELDKLEEGSSSLGVEDVSDHITDCGEEGDFDLELLFIISLQVPHCNGADGTVGVFTTLDGKTLP